MMRKLSSTCSSTPARGCCHWRPPTASASLMLCLRGGSSHGGGDPKGVVSHGLVVCQYGIDKCGGSESRMGMGGSTNGEGMSDGRRGQGRGSSWRVRAAAAAGLTA
jgi:hypothetical protein